MTVRWSILVGIALFLFVVLWFAIGGFDRPRNTPKWLTERPIAHRGLHSGDSVVPENSLAAFKAAADAGFAVELDVQMTRDGELVVIHDENLERLTGDTRDVADLTAVEVTKLRLLESSQTIPTLSQVLATVTGRVPIFAEVKNPGSPGALEDAVAREILATKDPVAVVSFNPLSLGRIHKKAPEIPLGQLTGTFEGEDLSFLKKFVLGRMLMNWKSKPDFIVNELAALPSLGSWTQRRLGRPLLVWTATTQQEYERASDVGDGVIFELDGTPRRAPAQDD